MKMMKKLIALICILAVMAASFGCGKKENTSKSVASAEGPFGKYEKTVEFSVARPLGSDVKFKSGENIEKNAWADLYLNELGIKLKYAWTSPEAQYDQKVSLIIASKDIPDILPVSLKDYYKLADAGMIEDLTDSFEKYASPLLKKFAEDSGVTMSLAKRKGKLMAMPVLGEEAASNAAMLYIRKDWLDNLGLDIPKNTEEYINAVKAFAKNDPDKNGKNDTFGVTMSKELFDNGINDMRGLMNGCGAYPGIWLEKNGKLEYGSIQPEVKNVLKILQQLYSEDCIDKEFVVKDRFKVGDDIKAGKCGSFFGVGWAMNWAVDNMRSDSNAKWIAMPIPTEDGSAPKVQTNHSGADSMYYVVKKGVENKEALIKMANVFAKMLYGSRFDEKAYRKYEFSMPEDGNLMISKYAFITAAPTNSQAEHWEACTAAFDGEAGEETDARVKIDVDNAKKYTEEKNKEYMGSYYSWIGNEAAFSVVNGYVKNDNLLFDKFVSYPTDTMVTSKSILEKKEQEVFTKIITGADVSLFDDFVKEWKELGGEKITNEVNEWYKNADIK